MAVDTLDSRLQALQADWSMINDLRAGTKIMRIRGEMYLPKHTAESAEGYKARLATSTLYNGLGRSVKTLAAKPFSEPLTFDGPDEVKTWTENIDLQGRNLHNFAHAMMDEGLAKGMCFLWVDYPRVPQGATVYDLRSQNVRPYFILVKPDQMLGWKTQRVNGYDVLTQVRFKTCMYRLNDEFTDVAYDRINVLEKTPEVDGVLWTAYELVKDTWAVVDQSVISVPDIPFLTFYAQRTEFMLSTPPLLDVAYLNVNHWQSQSDQNNITKTARVPILFGAGWSEEDSSLPIGSSKMLRSTNAQAKLEYVEHTGAAIAAGREELRDLEDQMRSMGAELLKARDRTQQTSATENVIEEDQSTCDLAAMAESLEDTLNMAFEFAAMFAGNTDPGMVTIFKDFAVELPQASDMDTILKMNVAGIVSSETVFKEAQRRDILSDDLDYDDEQERVQDDPTLLPPPSAPTPPEGQGQPPAPAQ